jgi:hypothetical protein
MVLHLELTTGRVTAALRPALQSSTGSATTARGLLSGIFVPLCTSTSRQKGKRTMVVGSVRLDARKELIELRELALV